MKILVVSQGKIGDIVVTTTLFRTLQKNFGRPVDLIAGAFAPNLLKGNDAVRKIFDFSASAKTLRAENYTHALVLMPSPKFWWLCRNAKIPVILGGVHKNMPKFFKLFSFLLTKKLSYDYETLAQDFYLSFAKELGASDLVTKREVYFDAQDREVAESFLDEYKLASTNLVGISLTAGKDYKEWSIENFRRLVDWLNKKGYFVVGIGQKADYAKLEQLQSKLLTKEKFLNASGKFSLSELAAVCMKMKVFVASDTGPLYIADALGVSVIDLVGPCQGQRPMGENAAVVGECQKKDHAKAFTMYCPSSLGVEYQRCMQEINFDEVKEAFEKVILAAK